MQDFTLQYVYWRCFCQRLPTSKLATRPAVVQRILYVTWYIIMIIVIATNTRLYIRMIKLERLSIREKAHAKFGKNIGILILTINDVRPCSSLAILPQWQRALDTWLPKNYPVGRKRCNSDARGSVWSWYPLVISLSVKKLYIKPEHNCFS